MLNLLALKVTTFLLHKIFTLLNKYVDEVIIGAPYFITESLIKNMNVSLVLEANNEAHKV